MGADNPVTATDLVSPAGQGPVKLGVWLREASCSGTVSTYVATIRLPDGAPVFDWLALLARSDRAKDAEILIMPATFYIASLPFQDTPQIGGSRT